MIIKNFPISKFFWFNEVVATSYLELSEKNTEGAIEFLHDATDFARDTLDECREYLGPFSPGSWFRGPELNAKAGGSATSSHMKGVAVDYTRWATWQQVQDWGQGLALHLKSKGKSAKIIMESKGGAYWLHLGKSDKPSLWTGIEGVYREVEII